MLKKPYTKIYSEGLTDYYMLGMDDRSYLAFDSHDLIDDPNVGFFTKLFRGTERKITTSMKLLPISGALMYLMTTALSLTKTGDVEEMFDETIDKYNVISDVDNIEVVKGLREMLNATGIDNFLYNFPAIPKNDIAKGYKKNGFNFMYVEEMNTLHRSYYLYRTNLYGFLHIVKIDESGKKGDLNITTSVDNYVMSRNLMVTTLINSGFTAEEIGEI